MRHLGIALVALLSTACFFRDDGRGAEVDVPDARIARAPDAAPAADACRSTGDAGAEITVAVTAQVTQWETAAAPAASVDVELHTAWDTALAFPVGCPALATATVGAADAFVAAFSAVRSPVAFVVAMYVSGAEQVLSVNDKRITTSGIGSAASPYPIWVLARATFDAWNTVIKLDAASGFAVVTFRDRDGKALAGVTPRGSKGNGTTHDLLPGKEVYFLAADRRTLETRTSTGASGTVVIPVAVGAVIELTGSGAAFTYETLNVATVAGGVFFEQIDPK